MPVFILLTFALAFVLRVVFAVQWQDMPYGASPQLDAEIYDKWAWDLAQGNAGSTGAFYQSPLYPYLLSLVYRIAGHSYFAASILNALLDSTTVVLLGLIARALFGNVAAIITAVLAATYAPMVFYTAPVMKEPLALFLLTLFLFAALRALRGIRILPYATTGLFLGLAILARGNLLLLAPIVPIFAWLRYGCCATNGVTAFLLAIFICFTPVVWHNAVAAHDLVPIAYDDGFNLYIGHSPSANGTNSYPPEVSTGPEQERIDVTWSAEQQAGHSLKPSEVSSFWRDKAIGYALTHPVREVELLELKFLAFWNNVDRFDNYDPVFVKQNFPSVLNGLVISFGWIAALAAFATVCVWPVHSHAMKESLSFPLSMGEGRDEGDVGIKTNNVSCDRSHPHPDPPPSRGRETSLILKWCAQDDRFFLIICAIAYMCSVLVFYVTDRYRLPAVVFMLPLAGAAVPYAASIIRARQYKKLVVASGAAALFLILAFVPLIDNVDSTAFDWAALTTIYADQGNDAAALDAFHKALAISPQGAGVQAYVHAAGVYEKRGQINEAEKWIGTAVALFPQDGIALYNLGRMQALRGDIDAALSTMQHAQKLDPTYGLTYFALAKLYDKKGDAKHAHQAIEQGLVVNPADTRLLELLATQNPDETK